MDHNYYYPYNYSHTLPEDYISPNSAAAHLGLTSAEMAPILQEQRELMRDEYAQPPPISALPIIHPGSTAARLGVTPEEMEEILADQEEWMREEEEQEERAGGYTWAEETQQQQQGRDNTDTRTLPPPLKYTHNMAHDDDDDNVHVVPFKHHDEPNDSTVRAEPDHDVFEPLARELVVPRDAEGDWAEELDEEMGLNIQGEYMPASYPPAPSPTP